jgi:aminodeoxyfutalosine synthase
VPPQVTIKAFSAIEIDDMCQMAGRSHQEGLELLQERGLNAIPGGGAEIFDPAVRTQICPDKADAQTWLSIHDTAHRMGIPSNATILFGHIETPEQQIDHLDQIRNQQDKSGGFTAFIPLKYRSAHNELSHLGEAHLMHTLRLFALSRLFLDNIPHIKAYWPMLGKEATQMALLFGADDLDGTIEQSTKIYSMAGAEEQNPGFTKKEVCTLIETAGYCPVERDSFYKEKAIFAGQV